MVMAETMEAALPCTFCIGWSWLVSKKAKYGEHKVENNK
jgi:hypothetical protein